MDSLSPQRKADLMDLFHIERWALLERRAELLALKHIITERLRRLDDAAMIKQKKKLNYIAITLKAIDLAVAYRDSEHAKERYEQIYQLQMMILGPYLFEEDPIDNAELNRIAAVAGPEIEAIATAEREEGWQIILANM
jgi:hypothetical protein